MKKELRNYFKKLGQKGGKAKSEAKAKAARKNIKLRWLKEKTAKLALLIIALGFTTGCQSLERLINGREVVESSSVELGTLTILVAGQSNAVAMGIVSSDVAWSENAVLVDSTSGQETTPTESSSADTSLTWIHLADLMGRKVRIINVAIGSTNSTQWANQYASRISDAVQRFQPNAIVWVQGENDTHEGFDTQTTYNNYKQIITQAHGVPFYVALDGFMPGLDPAPVRTAQNQIINEGLARRGPDVDALRTSSNMEWTLIHFSGEGFRAHAQAWATILNRDF